MNKNRIEGVAEQGERARNREALVIKAKWRKSGGCAVKECVLTWGDLASWLKGRRTNRSEKSAEAVVAACLGRRAEGEGVSYDMSMREALRQMPATAGRVPVVSGEAARAGTSDEALRPRHETGSTGSTLLLAALTRDNLQQAWKRVKANKGAAGVDGLDIKETARHLATAWPEIREHLLQGTYRPSPVRRVAIPKPDGGEREPTRSCVRSCLHGNGGDHLCHQMNLWV